MYPKRGVKEGTGAFSHLVYSLQTLCLKTQGHPERYKAASRALKAISKVRGDPAPPPNGRDTEPAFHSTSGESEARGSGACTQLLSPWQSRD